MNNHPVHILTSNSEMSPSAFIPFCEFGDIKVGVKITNFSAPVCNAFKATVLDDQLCYEVDLDLYARDAPHNTMNNVYQEGFSFIMDYNEDREVTFYEEKRNEQILNSIGNSILGILTEQESSVFSRITKYEDFQFAKIQLHTILDSTGQ